MVKFFENLLSLERFGLPKTGVGALWPSSWGLWRLWVFKMEHWRGFGPPTWSLGAPWASNLGSLGSFEVSKLGCRSQPSRKTWFCKLRWGKTCILCQKTTVVYRLGPPSWGLWSALGLQDGALERLWTSKLGSCSALDLQVEVLGRLWGLQFGVLERFGPPS